MLQSFQSKCCTQQLPASCASVYSEQLVAWNIKGTDNISDVTKVKFKWTDEKIEELITLYEARPFHYNTIADEYSNRDARRKATTEISSALGVSGECNSPQH